MTDTTTPTAESARIEQIVTRLAECHTVADAPRTELEWLAAHGSVERFEAGSVMSHAGEPITMGMIIVFGGRLSHRVEQGGVWRKVMEWRAGDVSGQLPYSRMRVAPGNTVIDETVEGLVISTEHVKALPVTCPTVTAALVHAMLDRARVFKASDSQVEKMASLGKLAAGLAHELNNPASAAARSATLLAEALNESDRASRALGAAQLSEAEDAALEALRRRCVSRPSMAVLSPLQRSDREETISDWLDRHGADESFAPSLGETSVTIEALDKLAATLPADKLDAALRWVASGCAIRALVSDIDRAATRVHQLVSAVKGFTYMGHATNPEPVDLGRSLADTLAVLGAKARSRSAALSVDVAPGMPQVRGFGGELNQVWMNLIDNALDAVGESGHVSVTARVEAGSVVVRVTDDGPGIPADLQQRIFDPFFTTKPVGKGTGLGLDIVRRLVERNEGLIEIESVPGKTEFRVTLPVA